MDKLKVAVAGAGFIGPAHIEALRRLPGIEVVAIQNRGADKVKAKAEELGIDHYYDDYQQLLESESLDCIHICTPNNLHYQMAKEALHRGIHVICEKPLAISIAEAMDLVSLAASKKLVNAVHFNIRYYPMVRQMRTMREKGELGDIYSII